MEDNNSNLPTESASDNAKSRRRFLTRASAGAMLATIPSKSVWATMSSNSIAASGHGSDFAGGHQLHLKSPHDWLKTRVGQLAYKYLAVCGGCPNIDWKLKRCLGNKVNDLFLCHLLGDTAELTNFFKKVGGKVGTFRKNNNTYHVKLFQQSRNKWRYYKWSDIFNYLGGNSELNKYIVSAYLNAELSGKFPGVFYPIVNSFNGSKPPFQSAEAFIAKIHTAAQHDPHGTLQLLKDLHHNPNKLRTA